MRFYNQRNTVTRFIVPYNLAFFSMGQYPSFPFVLNSLIRINDSKNII